MAIVTSIATSDMCRVLADSDTAVVAAAAGSDHLSMIDEIDRREGVRIVAILTYERRRNMCW